ncbi:MAG TPA: DNA polymerase IV, partial [Ilumatobacteraceae bacterium]
RRRGSIGSQHALGRSPKSRSALEASLLGIVDRVTRRMRNAGRAGRTITVRLRFDDFTRATRASSLPHPTAATEPIRDVALALFDTAMPMIAERGLTLIGLSVGNLCDLERDPEQLLLSFHRADRTRLDTTLDDLRKRFGNAVVTRASLLGRNTGFEVPKLPD